MTRKLFLCLLAVLISLPLLADERTGPVGKMSLNASAVEFTAMAPDVDRFELVVTTPAGERITREFSGTRGVLRLTDLGVNLTDGTYHFDLRGVPRVADSVRSLLADAHERGDDA